ncbi:hypothetical protein JCM11641_000322 [Rhodosporidiobolus odoratus]
MSVMVRNSASGNGFGGQGRGPPPPHQQPQSPQQNFGWDMARKIGVDSSDGGPRDGWNTSPTSPRSRSGTTYGYHAGRGGPHVQSGVYTLTAVPRRGCLNTVQSQRVPPLPPQTDDDSSSLGWDAPDKRSVDDRYQPQHPPPTCRRPLIKAGTTARLLVADKTTVNYSGSRASHTRYLSLLRVLFRLKYGQHHGQQQQSVASGWNNPSQVSEQGGPSQSGGRSAISNFDTGGGGWGALQDGPSRQAGQRAPPSVGLGGAFWGLGGQSSIRKSNTEAWFSSPFGFRAFGDFPAVNFENVELPEFERGGEEDDHSWRRGAASCAVLDRGGSAGLHRRVYRRNGFVEPTAIQAQAFPMAMSGKDLIAISETGSGKTIAYALPAILHINAKEPTTPESGPIALVLCPTRELATQILDVFQDLGKTSNITAVCIYGGNTDKEYPHGAEQQGPPAASADAASSYAALFNSGWGGSPPSPDDSHASAWVTPLNPVPPEDATQPQDAVADPVQAAVLPDSEAVEDAIPSEGWRTSVETESASSASTDTARPSAALTCAPSSLTQAPASDSPAPVIVALSSAVVAANSNPLRLPSPMSLTLPLRPSTVRQRKRAKTVEPASSPVTSATTIQTGKHALSSDDQEWLTSVLARPSAAESCLRILESPLQTETDTDEPVVHLVRIEDATASSKDTLVATEAGEGAPAGSGHVVEDLLA